MNRLETLHQLRHMSTYNFLTSQQTEALGAAIKLMEASRLVSHLPDLLNVEIALLGLVEDVKAMITLRDLLGDDTK